MSRFGQVATYQSPLQSTQQGGMISTVSSNTLGPSQTLSWLQAQQEAVGTRIYSKKILPQVGQPYQLRMSDDDVVREIYKATPTKASMRNQPAEGTEPQQILTMRSGLEIPSDILKRDFERKKALAVETEILSTKKPSNLLQIGHFANRQPIQAFVIALAVGAALGTFYYDAQH